MLWKTGGALQGMHSAMADDPGETAQCDRPPMRPKGGPTAVCKLQTQGGRVDSCSW